MRTLPNIIITGTPGVGKTTTCNQLVALASQCTPPVSLKYLSINDLVKERGAHSGYDEEFQTVFVDEEKLMDEVEKEIEDGAGEGGWIVDWHSTEGFAIRWVDLVVVLRCEETSILYDRLSSRGYRDEKVQENMDAEIFGVVTEEAREGWTDEGQVVELKSTEAEDIEENAERILQWIKNWLKDREAEAKANANGH
ncbi:dTMP kinase [Exophiala aquamarina CBS 119918]|uniref:Adenylate kinase isoenzyme 6 homolog n=1 Tax=Exophiala aquamarina CBS 119918 TaxID=1182545 RepID=A0A072PPI4_9EURO|nr:dTMP kinase [Exophiala aquamarina CBS 119918]KEF61657.1 dTMP kinase [Exophiala aquamarina CBS 119918]